MPIQGWHRALRRDAALVWAYIQALVGGTGRKPEPRDVAFLIRRGGGFFHGLSEAVPNPMVAKLRTKNGETSDTLCGFKKYGKGVDVDLSSGYTWGMISLMTTTSRAINLYGRTFVSCWLSALVDVQFLFVATIAPSIPTRRDVDALGSELSADALAVPLPRRVQGVAIR